MLRRAVASQDFAPGWQRDRTEARQSIQRLRKLDGLAAVSVAAQTLTTAAAPRPVLAIVSRDARGNSQRRAAALLR